MEVRTQLSRNPAIVLQAARPKTNGQLATVKIFLRLSGKNKMKITRARFGSDFNSPFQIPLQQKNFF
jgi:hypothetical protein